MGQWVKYGQVWSSMVKSFLWAFKNGIVMDCVHVIKIYQTTCSKGLEWKMMKDGFVPMAQTWQNHGIGSIPQDELNDDTVAIKKIERLSSMPWCYLEHV
jgi:hypothetical protein